MKEVVPSVEPDLAAFMHRPHGVKTLACDLTNTVWVDEHFDDDLVGEHEGQEGLSAHAAVHFDNGGNINRPHQPDPGAESNGDAFDAFDPRLPRFAFIGGQDRLADADSLSEGTLREPNGVTSLSKRVHSRIHA